MNKVYTLFNLFSSFIVAKKPHRYPVKWNITQTELAKHLGIHRNTLHKMMKTHGISKAYTRLTNPQLDTLIQSFKQSRPQSGIRYATGFLRRSNLRVQRHRVIQSL